MRNMIAEQDENHFNRRSSAMNMYINDEMTEG